MITHDATNKRHSAFTTRHDPRLMFEHDLMQDHSQHSRTRGRKLFSRVCTRTIMKVTGLGVEVFLA